MIVVITNLFNFIWSYVNKNPELHIILYDRYRNYLGLTVFCSKAQCFLRFRVRIVGTTMQGVNVVQRLFSRQQACGYYAYRFI